MIKHAYAISLGMSILTSSVCAGNIYIKSELGNSYAQNMGLTDNQNTAGSCQLCTAFSIDQTKVGQTYGAGLGYKAETMSCELMLNQRSNKISDYDHSQSGHMSSKVSSQSIMFNTYYHPIEYKGVKPFIGIGVGMSKNKLDDLSQSFPHGSNITVDQIDPGHTTYQTAWQKMVGLEYAVTPQVSMNIMYRSFDGGRVYSVPAVSWTNYTGNYLTKGIGMDNGHYRTNEVLVGIAKEF